MKKEEERKKRGRGGGNNARPNVIVRQIFSPRLNISPGREGEGKKEEGTSVARRGRSGPVDCTFRRYSSPFPPSSVEPFFLPFQDEATEDKERRRRREKGGKEGGPSLHQRHIFFFLKSTSCPAHGTGRKRKEGGKGKKKKKGKSKRGEGGKAGVQQHEGYCFIGRTGRGPDVFVSLHRNRGLGLQNHEEGRGGKEREGKGKGEGKESNSSRVLYPSATISL